jgi:hypothetical protein
VFGVDLYGSLSCPSIEEPTDESQRFENLERARMHHRGAVPMEWPRPGINQMAWNTAALKLRSKEQPRRSRTDHEHRRRVACPLGVAVLGRLF